MLKIRIIPTLLWKNVGLVKGVRFDSWRRVGSVMPAIKVYNTREVDELILLDITATREGRNVDYESLNEFSAECFVPLTVGGGVRTVEDVRNLLQAGADKVAVNTSAVLDPNLIEAAARRFGSQCIVVSIDAKRSPRGDYQAYTHSGTQPSGRDPVEMAQEAAKRGAGEILLTAIDKDGTMTGYDIGLTRAVSAAVSIPVIASGGAGNFEHMRLVLSEAGASAVAAASIFHFTEQTPLEAKRYLASRGFPMRLLDQVPAQAPTNQCPT